MKAALIVARALLMLVWFSVCTFILEAGIAGIRSPTDPELIGGAQVFFYGFGVVAFPLGIVMLFLVYQVFSGLASVGMPATPETELWVMGLAASAVGYVQWFHLAPWLFRRWIGRRSSPAALTSEASPPLAPSGPTPT